MQRIRLEENGTILTLSLNRPEIRNAFDGQMIEELTETFEKLQSDKKSRVLILKGEGESFCAGADLDWMKSGAGMSEDDNLKDSKKILKMFSAMEKIPFPILGQIHGHSMGGGMGLVALCDIVAAVDGTQFCFSEVRLGIAPAVISTFAAKKISSAQLHRWFLTAEIFESKEAKEMNFIHFCGDTVAVHEFVKKTAKKISNNGPEAVRATKKLIKDMNNGNVTTDQTVELIAKLRVSPEGQEGLQAFFDKRKPNWIEGQ